MVEFTKETVNMLGGNVVFQRGGSGEPILYLHGAGVVSHVVPFMKHLGEHFDLIVPQHPAWANPTRRPGSTICTIWRCSITTSSTA